MFSRVGKNLTLRTIPYVHNNDLAARTVSSKGSFSENPLFIAIHAAMLSHMRRTLMNLHRERAT